ncbi:glycosyl hydrolase family 95 catalytic domain-containing protein [Microbacterium sp. A93]|uniref:glycosyl hydrolase family 95 catalytic domain-containing protein n=1 Tax=Microbacterium sp. A93 TaxID=3450716 RepID=UPI003F430B82
MSTIRFTGTAESWLECLPLGDGRLGAMSDGGVATTTLHLNDATAWSGSPASEAVDPLTDAAESARLLAASRAAIAAGDHVGAEAPLRAMQTRYAQSYVPLGDVVIDVAGADPNAALTRELDLATGVHRSVAGSMRTTTFIAAEQSVLVHVIEPAAPAIVSLHSPLRSPDGDNPEQHSIGADTVGLLLRLPSDVAPGHEPDLPGALWDTTPGAALRAAIGARVIQESGRTVILVAAATTFAGLGKTPVGTASDALADALERIERATEIGVDALCSETERAMGALLGTVTLSLGSPSAVAAAPGARDTAARFAAARADPRGVLTSDPGLAALLFDYGRYLLVSSSRPGGLPANLQGIWNAELRPPWGSGYTLNINTEMNYWGAHVTDLSARAQPLADFTVAIADAAASHTRRLYGTPGWTVHHNSDAWLYATAPGRGAGDPRWAFWPLGGAWLASLLSQAWEFGAADAEDLENIWPTLRGAAEFALAWHRDEHTSPATSPENAFLTPDGRSGSLAATTAMDLALLRDLFTATVRTAEALGRADDDVVKAAGERLCVLPEQPALTPDGTIVEWDVPRPEEDPHHRHVSALYGLFPGTEHWDESRRAAATTTLERRGDDSSGWSLVWKLALWARLHRPDKVADLLELALRNADDVSGPWAGGLYPNLFAAHPPFQIDANLGIVGALSEALLQSVDGIHLLPALPAELGTGSVTGLVARPGVIVGLEWRDAQLLSATLRARHPAAVGSHRVRWRGQTITVHIDTEHDTRLDARSFPSEEVHP